MLLPAPRLRFLELVGKVLMAMGLGPQHIWSIFSPSGETEATEPSGP